MPLAGAMALVFQKRNERVFEREKWMIRKIFDGNEYWIDRNATSIGKWREHR